MKNSVKKILSIVLVVALFATMGVTAMAAVNITGETSTGLLVGDTHTLTAACGSDSSHSIVWDSANDAIATVSNGTVTAVGKGTVNITAKCSTCNITNTAAVTVKCCNTTGCNCAEQCKGTSCACNACTKTAVATVTALPSTTAEVGGSIVLSASVKSACKGTAVSGVNYKWATTSSNVTLSGENTSKCTVKGTAAGPATITLTCTHSTYTTIEQVNTNITIKPVKPTVTGGGTVYAYTGEDVTLTVSAKNSANTTTGITYEWYKGNTIISGETSSTYTIPAENIPKAGESYSYTCKAYYSPDGTYKSEPEPESFTVKPINEYTITIDGTADSVPYGSSKYFSATVKKNTINSNKSAYTEGSVSGGTITWSVPNTNYLYFYNSGITASKTGSPVAVYGAASNTAGVELKATYTNGSKSCEATRIVKVQNDFAVTMNSTATVVVGSATDAAKVTAVKDTDTGKSAYNTPVAGNYYYEVEYTSDNTSVATVSNATGYEGVVTGIAVGSAKITAVVTVYSDYTKALKLAEVTEECTVRVVSNDFDICANIKSGSTINLADSYFTSWYNREVGDSYTMNYVVLGAPSLSYGSFKHSGVSFTPDGVTPYYVTGRTGTKYIANTSYTATSGSYYITVPFTCYGGTTTTSYNMAAAGTLYIFVNAGSVGAITYDVSDGYAEVIRESDFLSTYNTATGSTNSFNTYNIKLLDVPELGSLYIDYASASNVGTKITESNYSSHTFSVSGYSSQTQPEIGDLTYVPGTRAYGNDTIRYAAYSASGTLLYVGRLVFDNGESNFTTYSEGYTFKKTDFYSATDADPVVSVKFTQPSSGKLYTGYANGRGTAVASTDQFYTNTAITGMKGISAVTYIPAAGYSGEVEINVTATTQSDTTFAIKIAMDVKSKTASTVFTDVTSSNTGSWSANAVDYAYKWGLVNGNSTTKMTYGPSGSMTRAQFVTILYRAAGSPTVSVTNPFKDVTDKTSYYYNAVLWAYENGIVGGTSTTTFSPGNKIKRQDIAKILYGFDYYINNKAVPTGGVSLTGYTDAAKVSTYAVSGMQWAVGNGIITSASATAKVLNPSGTATRAQVATMLHRYLTK